MERVKTMTLARSRARVITFPENTNISHPARIDIGINSKRGERVMKRLTLAFVISLSITAASAQEPQDPTSVSLGEGSVPISEEWRRSFSIKADASSTPDAYIVTLDDVPKAYFAVAGGASAPGVVGAINGDTLFRSENQNMIFSANAGASSHMWITNSGRVGVGTTTPTMKFDTGGWPGIPSDIKNGGANVSGDLFVGNTLGGGRFRQGSNAVQGFVQWNVYYNGSMLKLMDANRPGYDLLMSNATNAGQDGIYFARYTNGSGGAAVGTSLMAVTSTGVGLGFATPAYKLHVNGSARFEGTVTGQNITAHYQDLAEWVPATESLEPGTVVVVEKGATNTVTASFSAYDTAVAGVISARPGITLGVAGPNMVQVATTGRVRVRVDATAGPIAIGDLLVTSGVRGTAMRSMPMTINRRTFHQPGTLLGKALEPLEKGVGEILVLLSLQ
jgi:hypothetical protein